MDFDPHNPSTPTVFIPIEDPSYNYLMQVASFDGKELVWSTVGKVGKK